MLFRSRRGGTPPLGNQVFAIDQENIEPAIAVRIEERAAGAHGFRQPFLSGAPRVVRKVNAGSGRDFGEVYVLSGRRMWLCRADQRREAE